MPSLSIIIPTFNAAETLWRCLASIEEQNFVDYEVLIQDGISSDRTLEVAHQFKERHPRIRVSVRQERDNGVYDAMNKAITWAQGEWLYFIGSDDELFDETVLSKIMNSPEAATRDVLYGNVRIIGDTGWAKNATYDGRFTLDKLLTRNICHQAMFYRAKFAHEIGPFNTKYRVNADWDFNFRCWAKTTFGYLDVVIARFRAGGISSHGPDAPFRAELRENVIRYFDLTIDDPLINRPEFTVFTDIAVMQGFSNGSEKSVVQKLRAMARRLGLRRR